MGKEEIRQMGLSFGADVVGFAAVEDYQSKRAPDPKTLFPGVRSMIVLGFREINGSLASEIGRIGMHSRIGQMGLTRDCTFHTAKALEDKYKVKAVPIMPSYPLNMAAPYMGLVADVSLRHAAVAAGLGSSAGTIWSSPPVSARASSLRRSSRTWNSRPILPLRKTSATSATCAWRPVPPAPWTRKERRRT